MSQACSPVCSHCSTGHYSYVHKLVIWYYSPIIWLPKFLDFRTQFLWGYVGNCILWTAPDNLKNHIQDTFLPLLFLWHRGQYGKPFVRKLIFVILRSTTPILSTSWTSTSAGVEFKKYYKILSSNLPCQCRIKRQCFHHQG